MSGTVESSEFKTKEQWVDFIAQQELPALTSTARLLEKFENDDISSLPKLSKAILHDQALSSCVIKVANSVNRYGVASITTVSRATVVLGIQTVKNICLTSKIIEGLLKNEQLGLPVYNRIKQLMARSFFAGQLAKMMVPEYTDDLQEELYLASMLHSVGETAFWGVDSKVNKELLPYTKLSDDKYREKTEELLGMSFEQLSIGLAQKWNLGELLAKSFDEPELRTKEMQIIHLASKLSEYIDSPPASQSKFEHILREISSLMKINGRKLKYRIELTRERSIKLLNSYGADKLIEYLKPLPTVGDFNNKQTLDDDRSKEAIQLEVIQNLTQLSVSSRDLNEFLQTVLIGLAHTLSFHRHCFMFLSKDKSEVTCRFSYNEHAIKEDFNYKVDLRRSNTVFRKSLTENSIEVINNIDDKAAVDLISKDVSNLMGNDRMIVAPVKIGESCIGFICCIKAKRHEEISEDEKSSVTLLVQQLNMCLSMVTHR